MSLVLTNLVFLFFPTVGKIDRGGGGGNEASMSRVDTSKTRLARARTLTSLAFIGFWRPQKIKKARQKKRLSISRSDDDDDDDDDDGYDDYDVSAQLVRPKRSMMEKASLSSFKFSFDSKRPRWVEKRRFLFDFD